MKGFNITQLNPFDDMERGIIHRDLLGHVMRWSHILKITKPHQFNLLDWGCGNDANLVEVLYRNKHPAKKYLGLDIRKQAIQKTTDKWKNLPWASFKALDLVGDVNEGNDWDIITCLEVIEHCGKINADKFLQNILKHMNQNTRLYLSTPCYDERVGAAGNHTYDSGDGGGVAVQEFTYDELKQLLEKYFIIEKQYGVFGSQRDYKPFMNDWQKKYFESVSEYYDSNILSILMAPMFPESSRNVMWICKLK